ELSNPHENLRLFAIAKDQFGAAMPSRDVRWVSSDPSVIEVTAKGALIPHRDGSAVVVASVGGIMAAQPVRVRFYLAIAVPEDDLLMKPGESRTLAAQVVGTGGRHVDAPMKWTSSAPRIAVV